MLDKISAAGMILYNSLHDSSDVWKRGGGEVFVVEAI